ncbi:TPA: hypothetical protein N0F65_001131 [Lagenidium giganteum]|uniref:Uncharacterized protein n=1 Tax=Lagenidium giganteum TaxID=4803 RepID=A0AAV2YWA9_9STRA|nr:TPA: hypothetical protein N0F65_001131 [Lagenidium giganteum]
MSGEALREAICDGDVDTARRMIEEEHASVDYVDVDDGWPLVLWAVKSNQPACLRVLLEHKANVHMGDASSNTALHKAAYLGHTECLEQLLAHGALLQARNAMQQTPLDLAELFDRKDVVELLQRAQHKPEEAAS